MDYSTALGTLVYGLLEGSSDLVAKASGGIHNRSVPPGTAPPYVVFDAQPAPNTLTHGIKVAMATFDTTIQAVITDAGVTNKPYADAMAIDIDAVMGSDQGLVIEQNNYRFTVRRVMDIDRATTVQKRLDRFRGAKYRINVRALA